MGYTRNGRPYWYEVIPAESVRPASMVPLADDLAAWVTSDLSLPEPLRVMWFTRRSRLPVIEMPPPGETRTLSTEEAVERLLNMNAPSTLYGRFLAVTPDVIYLRAVRDRHALAMYLLHEARHVWQHANGKFPQGTREEFEAWRADGDVDATAYEGQAYQKVFSLIRQYDEAE